MIYGDARRSKPEKTPKKAPAPLRQGTGTMPLNFLCTDQAGEREVLKYRWNPVLYRLAFEDGDALRRSRMRLAVLHGTLAECSRKNFRPGTVGVFCDEDDFGVVQPKVERSVPVIRIVASDVLDCALWIREVQQQQGVPLVPPTVLVMASRAHLGGGYKNGTGAQEEHVYRGTSISVLHEADVQLKTELSMLICEKVAVVRGSERHGYPFVNRTWIRTISMAGISHPQIEVGFETLDLSSLS